MSDFAGIIANFISNNCSKNNSTKIIFLETKFDINHILSTEIIRVLVKFSKKFEFVLKALGLAGTIRNVI